MPTGRARKRADEVAERLRDAIQDGVFPRGDALPPERALMERFGVGRPAVREALFMLQQEGLVEIRNGLPPLVTAPSPTRIVAQLATLTRDLAGSAGGQEHMEQARLLFESGVAWQAAQVATDADIARIEAALEANVAAHNGPTAEFIRTDVAFHFSLIETCHNPIFTAIHDVMHDWLVEQRATTIVVPEADRFSIRDHRLIFEAVAAHDPHRAFHEMASHLRLISRLHKEARRLADEILRSVSQDVAARMEAEKEALWAASFGTRTQARPKGRNR